MNPGFIQLHAALLGNYDAEITRGRTRVVKAMGAAMEDLSRELVERLRADVARSGLSRGERLAKAAWRGKTYGAGRSLEPAAQIFSKVPVIIQAFENGQTIRARAGKGLLIPNPEAWPAGRVPAGRGRTNLSKIWAIAEARFGRLQIVTRPGKTTLVVAEARASSTVSGRWRKASTTATRKSAAGQASGLATIVVFVIAKQAKQPRLLASAVIKARVQASAPARMDTLFLKYFTATEAAGPA